MRDYFRKRVIAGDTQTLLKGDYRSRLFGGVMVDVKNGTQALVVYSPPIPSDVDPRAVKTFFGAMCREYAETKGYVVLLFGGGVFFVDKDCIVSEEVCDVA